MKAMYAVYRNETLIGLVSSEEDACYVVCLDEENRKSDKTFSISDKYSMEKIYTNLECGL